MYSHSNSKFLPQPFDEGVTDYLATRALGYGELDSIRASGYPLEVQVVIALLEKIPEDEFLDVYFNKDETKLKTLMKKYFPDTSYAEFMAKYDAIFDETYHINGTSHSFGRGLIDHKDVVSVRQLLGLKEKKFQYVVY
jgi:hypothetical protein